MCCLHRRKGSHSNELCGSLRAATRMRSGWSLGSKRKFGREVLPIIGFGIVQILKSTGDTFTIIPWHTGSWIGRRSEEHTSELQSLTNLVCRLLLEKKK